MRKQRILAIVATLAVGASLVTPRLTTADATANFNPVGTYPIVKQPMTIRMFMVQYADQRDLTTNLFTKQVEQLTNVHLDWVIAPNADYQAKLQLALTSGNYPPVLMAGFLTKSQLLQYGQQGLLINLKPLIDKYAPHIKAAMAAIPLLKAAMTTPTGAIYTVPPYNACFHCWVAQRAWINNVWLKKLHLSMPTTTAEFVTVLKAFKKQYPNTVPLDGEGPGNQDNWHTNMVPYFMNSFIYDNDSDYLYIANKKVQLAPMQQQWRNGLAFLHQMWNDGLINQAAFSQKFQDMQALGHKSPLSIGVFTAALVGGVEPFGTGLNQWHDYSALAPLKGPDGTRMAGWLRQVGGGDFEITNKASADEAIAAIRVADYLYTLDGSMGVEFGPKGVMWNPAKKGMLGLNDKPAMYFADPSWWGQQTQNWNWDQSTPSYRPRWIFDGRWSGNGHPEYAGGYEKFLYDVARNDYYPYHAPYSMVYPEDAWISPQDSQQLSQIQINVNSYISTWTVQFITGKKDLQKDWASYVQGFAGLQADKELSIYQKAYTTWSKTYPPTFLAPEAATVPSNASLFTAPQVRTK